MKNKKLVRTLVDVKIYILKNGAYSVEAKNLKPIITESFDDAWKIAVSYCE